MVWRNKIPSLLISGIIFILVIEFYVDVPVIIKSANSDLRTFAAIIAAFAMLLGSANLTKVFGTRIIKKSDNWEYALLLIVCLFSTIGLGLVEGIKGNYFLWLYKNVQVPAAATVYALIGFFVVFAAYRAFRAKTLEATILLFGGFLSIMWGSSLGHFIWPGIDPVYSWLVDIPNMAGFRGYSIAVAVATVGVGAALFLQKQKLFQKAGASGEEEA